jgi:hypothetical protein
MHTEYRDIFVSRIAGAIGMARATAEVTHSGVKGAIREILIRELLRPLLPSDVGIGTGRIATSGGQSSTQQDIIIYNRRILPPVLFEETLGVFPIESVLAIVEVKSTLTSTELRSSHENAKAIQEFPYRAGERVNGGVRPTTQDVKRAISTIFAFSSDLASGGKTELERLTELDSSDDPPVRAICVSGRGYWFYTNEWCYISSDDRHRETMSFIVGLIDMLAEVGATRHHPRLVGYLMDEPPILRGAAEP